MVVRLLFIGALAGCTTGGDPPADAATDTRPAFDTTPGMDTGSAPCTNDPDCNDGISCTVDLCGVGNVCRNMTVNESCPSGQFCSPTEGCIEGCSNDTQCDDGVFCNGPERCIVGAGCFDGDAPDCDDGNDCTIDMCDPAVDTCRYENTCDTGTMTDTSPPCDPFDAATHLAGTFRLLPPQNSACSAFSFSITEVTFSTGGGMLTVGAGGKTLTQSPVPTGATFSVRGSDSCGRFEIDGAFDCADRWSGMWRATPQGSCAGLCSAQTAAVVGIRR